MAEDITRGFEADSCLVESLLSHLLADEFGFGDSPQDRTGLAAAIGIAEARSAVFEEWIDWLLSRDILVEEARGLVRGPRWGRPTEFADNVRFSEMRVRLPLLASVMRGGSDPLQLLDDELLSPEALLQADPPTLRSLDKVAALLLEQASSLGRPLRIAELGARTGRTAQYLLSKLPSELVSYTLFEHAATLAAGAQLRLASLPHQIEIVRHLEQHVPEGFVHYFDAVIANNALHRASDITIGLAHAALLAAPGGHLLAVESTQASPLALLSARLLEDGLLDRSPLHNEIAWRTALDNSAWCHSQLLTTGSSILMLAAQAPGVSAPTMTNLRDELKERLPPHSIPEQLVLLVSLPLSENGKVDRRAVRDILQRHSELQIEVHEPPLDEFEIRVAALWEQVLGTREIGRHQGFFALGGDSLSATRLVEAMRAKLCVDLTLRQLFSAPTIAGVAALISAQWSGIDQDDVMEGSL